MRLALPILVALVAAGCTTPTLVLDPAEQTPDFPSLVFRDALDLPGPPGFEPSVTVDPSGNVYATAARGVRLGPALGASLLWVSHDGGTTFRNVAEVEGTSVSNMPTAFEGHLDANAEGTVYYVDLTLANVNVARSTDGGRTWEMRTPAAMLAPGGDREWVAAGPGGAVYTVWNQIPTGFWIVASSDGGLTWPVQTSFRGTDIAGDARGEVGWSFVGVPAVAPDGTVYVARGEPDGLAVYASKDGARTFERTLAWTPEGTVGWLFSTATVDEAGTLYVSTVEQIGGNTRVRYAYSKDQGATFSAPREVSSAPGTHAMQWGAAGKAGHFAVAFYEMPTGNGIPDKTTGDWHVRVALSRNADSPDAVFEEGRPTENVVHQGSICTGGLGNCEGNSRDLGDYLGVDVGWDGSVHVIWAESSGDSKIRYARTA